MKEKLKKSKKRCKELKNLAKHYSNDPIGKREEISEEAMAKYIANLINAYSTLLRSIKDFIKRKADITKDDIKVMKTAYETLSKSNPKGYYNKGGNPVNTDTPISPEEKSFIRNHVIPEAFIPTELTEQKINELIKAEKARQ
jgi:hypothetical protein